MPIGLDKILQGISPEQYCEAKSVPLSNYNMEGVHVFLVPEYLNRECTIEKFADSVSDKAEVVVEYNPHFIGGRGYKFSYIASGVALIPKLKHE